MKLMAVFIILLMTADISSGQEWLSDLEGAKQASAETGRPILLVFSGSDWCAPCIRFKKNILDKDEFLAFAEKNLILLNVDFPRKRKNKQASKVQEENDRVAEIYNPQGAFPMVLLLDEGGIVLQELGHQGPDATYYVQHLSGLIIGQK